MLLFGRRDSAGTNVAAPSAAPKTVVPATAASAASGAGQPSVCSKRVHRQRADDAERALGKIDDAGDAIHQREAQRDDGKHAALKQPADDDRGHRFDFPLGVELAGQADSPRLFPFEDADQILGNG